MAARRGEGDAARQKSLTIGAVCKALAQEFPDISISKIRYLEDQKLLTPRRTPGGYRAYDDRSLQQLDFINLLRGLGLPLKAIRPLSGLWERRPCRSVRAELAPDGILARNDAALRAKEGLARETVLLHGDVPRELQVEEHGVRYLAAPWTGQKTGAFLDQRENRALVGRIARGRALDCFSYHGSFALHLARGADEVTALDVSADALARAARAAPRACIMLWYPVKSLTRPNAMMERLAAAGVAGVAAELVTTPLAHQRHRLNGSGVLLVRAPAAALEALAAAAPEIGARCATFAGTWSFRMRAFAGTHGMC